MFVAAGGPDKVLGAIMWALSVAAFKQAHGPAWEINKTRKSGKEGRKEEILIGREEEGE